MASFLGVKSGTSVDVENEVIRTVDNGDGTANVLISFKIKSGDVLLGNTQDSVDSDVHGMGIFAVTGAGSGNLFLSRASNIVALTSDSTNMAINLRFMTSGVKGKHSS